MDRVIRVGEIAFARSGDKGASATLAIFARDREGFEHLQRGLTADRVFEFFSPMGCTSVQRFSLPKLRALNFFLRDILAGGGSRSLRIDAQGKAIGQIALEMVITVPIKGN